MYLVRTITWVLASSWTYGYHIACLNQIQHTLTCPSTTSLPTSGLPECVPMSSATFGFVTSVFTLGGLLGSLASNRLMHGYGRKGALQIDGMFVLLGSLIMGLAWSPSSLIFGRFLIGIGCGLGLCVAPIYLSEIAPENIKGSVGVLHQVSVVIGLLATQIIGLVFSTPASQKWRYVFLASGAVVVLQLLFSGSVADTPSWLTAVGRDSEAKIVAKKLKKHINPVLAPNSSAEEQGLLAGQAPDNDADRPAPIPTAEPLGVTELFKVKTLQKPVAIVLLAMFAQQISGINAVIFYSNDILSRVVPISAAGYISLGIATLNALMTFPAITLIQRLGRRTLLLGSMSFVFLSLALLGAGLNSNTSVLSSIAILLFVSSFAIGLGPVPFVLIGDLVPFYAVSSLSSMALSLNWITNFVVGVGFIPLRDFLAGWGGGEGGKEGRIFFLFATLFGISMVVFMRLYR